MPNSEEDIICSQLNEIEDIREIPLSEGSFYTLVMYMYAIAITSCL